MATQWRMKGPYFKNCNCAPGCPCDFWAAPTHGHCEGMLAMRIDEGHFDSTPLTGISFAGIYYFPGALHLGNGTFQLFISAQADPAQRQALLTICSGKAGNAWFEVVPSLISKMLPPKFVPIEFECDPKRLHAVVRIPGELETVTESIKDLVSGQPHKAQVILPKGMEYKACEVATTRILRSNGAIRFDCPPANSSLAYVEHTQDGLLA